MSVSTQFCNDCRRAVSNVLLHLAGRNAAVMAYRRGDNPLAAAMAGHLVSTMQRGGYVGRVVHLGRTARLHRGDVLVLVTLLTNDEGLNTVYDQLLPEGVVKDVHEPGDDFCQLVINCQYTEVREHVAAAQSVVDDLVKNCVNYPPPTPSGLRRGLGSSEET